MVKKKPIKRKKPRMSTRTYVRKLHPKKAFFIGLFFVFSLAILTAVIGNVPPTVLQSLMLEDTPSPTLIPSTPTPTIIPRESYRIPILMYHYIEYVADPKDTIRISLNINPRLFEKQIQTMQNAGYTFLTMRDVADILDARELLPEHPVVLTFDDGYRDFYQYVFPILKKYHVKAVAYVVPGFFDHPNYMLKTEIIDIDQSGLVEVAAHTMHHVYLKDMFLPQAEKEIVESKVTLENMLHHPVVSFAYPYGAFDKQAVQIVEEAGFRTAVTTKLGIDASIKNRFTLYRIRPGARSGDALLRYLSLTKFPLL